ncbi:MAG TPA: rhomboid family intramembrane serine protease [Candidatus Polarisedimenticolaceae bacterium]|nr:rhomboid family intramembrane serine protease [Candidatus Polarisedimenticolaceae bacterium]
MRPGILSALLAGAPAPARVAESGLSVPWATAGFVVLALAATTVPGLEYDRAAMLRGEIWRPVTGQLLHWSWPMAAADLGVIAVAGTFVERRARRRVVLGLAAGLLAVAVVVALSPGLLRYRGSSGVATALVTLALTDERLPAGLALSGLLLLLAKTAIEGTTGQPLLPGTLPHGVALTTSAHVAGLLAGLAVGLTVRLRA